MGTLARLGVCTAVLANDNAVVNSVADRHAFRRCGSLCVRIYDIGNIDRAGRPTTSRSRHP